MTTDEMKNKIKEYCEGREYCDNIEGEVEKCPLFEKNIDFCHECGGDIEGLKSNYEDIFGSVEFTKSDLQECDIVILRDKRRYVFFDKRFIARDGLTKDINVYDEDLTSDDNKYDIIKVYRNDKLIFDRKEIEEDINTKTYMISDIRISPNYKTYKDLGDGEFNQIFIKIENNYSHKDISFSDAKEIIKSLQEIVDYVEGKIK